MTATRADATTNRTRGAAEPGAAPPASSGYSVSAAVVILIALAVTGCVPDLHGLTVLYPETGDEATVMFAGESYCAGDASMALPPAYHALLEGEWIAIGGATDLQAVVVRTPAGLLSAADLADRDRPTAIATLAGEGIRMICVCNESAEGRPAVACADSLGNRWTGRRRPEGGSPAR